MKRQIRRGVFETNSSSTHSIAIPKNCGHPNSVSFYVGDFGWSFNEVSPVSYFYTALYATSETAQEFNEKIEKLRRILDKHNINYYFSQPKTNIWHDDDSNIDYFSLDDGYIDHGYELRGFIDELLNDDEKLLRFLYNGLVFTGNDNSNTEERCFIERDAEYLDDYDWKTKQTFKVKNPYYMSNHQDYDWYYKGN